MRALFTCASLASASGAMWGVSSDSSLISIDMVNGKFSAKTKSYPDILEAQELSAIDTKRSVYYTMGVNQTSNAVELFAWSIGSGYHIKSVKLPFVSSALVGLGQALNVDPEEGTIIVMGHDPTHAGHHAIYKVDPTTFNTTFVADVGGDMHSDLLGCSTGYDYTEKVAYVSIAYNDSSPKPAVKFAAVSITTGKVDVLDKSLMMAGLAFDGQTNRVYGTSVTVAATGEAVSPWVNGVVAYRGRRGADGRRHGTMPSYDGTGVIRGGGTNGYTRSLAYFATKSPTSLTTVAPLALTGAVGDLHTLDVSARVHYTLLLGLPNMSNPYLPTDFCSAHNEPCPTGASCCCEPPCTDAAKYGYCYAVEDCGKIPPDGDPLKVDAFLYGVHLDTGKLASKTPICSLEPSNATVNQPCPWSVESAGAEYM